MFLESIHIVQFKNIQDQKLRFSARFNCFVGLNGVGKTNLLDAIYFLCLCRSHRSLPDKNLVQHGAGFFRIEAQMQTSNGLEKVVSKFVAGQRKEFERNDVGFQRLSDYIGLYPVVMLAPDDVGLVQEGSEERRRFLDSTLSQVSGIYLQQLMAYNKLLQQRNALLKTFAEERRFDSSLLEIYEQQMAPLAKAIYEARHRFCADLTPLLQAYYADIAGGRELASLLYDSDQESRSIEDIWLETREKDRLLQRTTSGPHRDDLQLSLDGHPVKKFASQGQLKSYLLAMRLAQYEFLRSQKGVAPILLLDDIFDKLDAKRVQQLLAMLIERQFGQIFITDAQRSRMEAVLVAFAGEYQLFEIDNGGVI